jgi:hypothetical protein
MSGRYLTDLADVLRAAGLRVVEVEGWQTRARSSGGYADGRPWCVMWHHTASETTPQNDVNYIVYNCPDAPVANLYLARDGEVSVCAGGAANTNGKGDPQTFSKGTVPLDSMNTYAIGVEAANSGLGETWPQVQIDAYFTLNDALTAAYGLEPTDLCSHHQYAPSRKIDPATAAAVEGPWEPRALNSSGSWNLDDIRSEALARADNTPGPGPEPPEPPPTAGGLMFTILTVIDHPEALGGMMDGNGIIAQLTWLSPKRYDDCKAAGAGTVTVALPDVANCDLLGPIPPSMTRGDFANVIP